MEKRSEFRPHIIRAGAGTGKTFALIEKVFRLIDEFERLNNGRKPRLIVSTFTRKAAAELSERLSQKAFDRSFETARYIHSPGLFVGTLHSLFSSFLKECGCQIAVPSDFQMISDEEEKDETSADVFRFVHENSRSLLHRMSFEHLNHCLQFYCKERMRRGGRPLDFYNEKDFEEFPALFEEKREKLNYDQRKKAEEGLFAGDFIPVFQEFQKAAERFFPEFEEKKKRGGRFTPNDFEGLLQNVFREKKGAARRISEAWDYWLIDEFQDTSRIQEEILQTLTQFKNVFCVGDPGQSVYLFRGADPAVFDRRVRAFQKACGEKPEELILNRRSRPALIAFFNELFAEKKSDFLRLQAELLSDSPAGRLEMKEAAFPPVYLIPFLSSPEKDQDIPVGFEKSGNAALRKPPLSGGKTAFRETGKFKSNQYKSDADSREERAFEALYQHIQKLFATRPSGEDIAILSNKNETLTELSLFLERKQTSSVFAGKGRFIKNRAVKDALILFKFLANPFDDQNLLSLLRAPLFRISDKTLTVLYRGYKKGRRPDGAANPAGSADPAGSAREQKTTESQDMREKDKSLWDYTLKYFTEENVFDDKTNARLLPPAAGEETSEDARGAADAGGALDSRGAGASKEADAFRGAVESEIQSTALKLRSCLALKKSRGLISAFENLIKDQILRPSVELSSAVKPRQEAPAAQDRAALWKMLQCLHGRRKAKENPLNFYYDFINGNLHEEENKEPIVEGGEGARPVRLLTVHKAKGLEFDHVIILNLSRQKSAFKDEIIFDDKRGKSAFSVPSPKEGRRGSKKKSFGHYMFNRERNKQEEEESDRQLYTAVTRAKQSLAFLVPDEWGKKGKNAPPWLKRFSFFETCFYRDGKLAKGFFEKEGWSYQAGTTQTPQTPAPLTQETLQTQAPPAPEAPPLLTAGRFFKERTRDAPAKKRFLSSTDFIAFSEKALADPSENTDSSRKNISAAALSEKKPEDNLSGHSDRKEDPQAPVFPSNETERESLKSPSAGEPDGKPLAGNILTADSRAADSRAADSRTADSRTADASAAEPSSAGGAVNAFIKAQSGLELHHYLRLLAVHPADRVQKTLQSSSASADSKGALKKALDYVLKDPDLSFFIQNGFAEQEFKLKEGDFILQGRIDLWGWRGKTIFLFDYKSGGAPRRDAHRGGAAIDRAGSDLLEAGLPEAGLPEAGLPEAGLPEGPPPVAGLPEASEGRAGLSGAPSSVAGFRQSADRFAFAAEKQLAFYSFVLNRLFRPEAVRAFLVFPFQETMKERLFSMEKTEREIALFLKNPSYTGLY